VITSIPSFALAELVLASTDSAVDVTLAIGLSGETFAAVATLERAHFEVAAYVLIHCLQLASLKIIANQAPEDLARAAAV